MSIHIRIYKITQSSTFARSILVVVGPEARVKGMGNLLILKSMKFRFEIGSEESELLKFIFAAFESFFQALQNHFESFIGEDRII